MAAAPTVHQLARLFEELYAATAWHPQRRLLEQLLANATVAAAALSGDSGGSGSASGSPNAPTGSWDASGFAAALLAAAGDSPASVGSGGGSGGDVHPDPDAGGPVDIGWLGLLLGALVIAINGLISVWLRLGLHGKLAVASVRCIAQLSVLGYILVPIFTANRWWLTLLYSLFMLAVAAVEAVSRPIQTYSGMLLQVLAALGLASSAVISYGLALVVRVSPWYDPQYLIPMLGMLLGNACSGVAVGLSTILDELSAGRDKVEMLLAMGATRLEATRDVVQRASRMALTPLLNTMNVVGIVSIPGMMTGQILGGSDPAKAARYQIIIMFLIGAATGISSVATIFLAVLSLLDDKHRLRSERLVSQGTGASGAVAWLGSQISQGWQSMRTRGNQLSTRLRLAFNRDSRRTRRHGGGSASAAAQPRYRALPGGSGGGAAADGGAGEESTEGSEVPSLPSRLREVLVAGSVSSSATWGDRASPPSNRTLLGPEASADSSSWSPRR